MKVITRKILIRGIIETDIEFTHSMETISTISLWNDKIICWYEKNNNNILKEIHGKVLSCNRTFIIEKNDKKAVYSLDGAEIIPFDNYDYIIENTYAIRVVRGSDTAAYSYDGKQIVPFTYPDLIFDKYGISINVGGYIEKGLFSYKGEVIVPKEYKIQYIDKDIIICAIEDEDSNDIYGMYSHDGEILIPFEYDSIAQYNKCVLAEKNDKCGMLSNTGEILVPFEYCDIEVVEENTQDYFIASKNNKYEKGLYKYNGKEILPPVYNDILYEQGCVITIKDGCYGLYTVNGLELLKTKYMNIYSNEKYIFIVKTLDGSFYYISSINKIVYANDVTCIGEDYFQEIDGVWTLIEEY